MFSASKDEFYCDVLNVSIYKPLAYMEHGEFEGKDIRSRCLAYIPEGILKRLLQKEDIYVMTKKIEKVGDQIREIKNPPQNPRLKLTEGKNDIGLTHVFHLPALKEMLQLNINLVNEMMGHHLKEDITDDDVFSFVIKLSKNKNWTPSQQALIDACFADPIFLNRKPEDREKIKLSSPLEKFFMRYKEESAKNNLEVGEHFKLIEELLLESPSKNKNISI